MRKLLIDVTDTVTVTFTSGIQRVVKELSLRLIDQGLDLNVLAYNTSKRKYDILDSAFYRQKLTQKNDVLRVTGSLPIKEINANYCFFDMDSVWNSYFLRRQRLYAQLKSKGATIGVLIHDVIPVTHPQYCHRDTVFHFLPFLSSVLEYADFIFVTTEATKQRLCSLYCQCNRPLVPIHVVPLGADFQNDQTPKAVTISESVLRVTQRGPFLLTIGTLEPRKNHAVLLDAFEKGLQKTPLNIVIAGRSGWNIEAFIQRLKSHPAYGKRIFFIEGPSDEEVRYLYQHTYAVVFPTFEEGFGLPIIEAFHYGSPVFASDIPVCREVGQDYADYFAPNKPEDLVALAEKYLNEPNLYDTMRKRTLQYHALSWDNVANVLLKQLKGYLEN